MSHVSNTTDTSDEGLNANSPRSPTPNTEAPPPKSRSQKFITGALADLTGALSSDPNTEARKEGSTDFNDDALPDPLPMTVWLRGDETYCGHFNLDADAVMAQLGIKRTRLTQISGRELRVGRIKRGRYIVPVYRPTDIDEYLQWTRATATHLKSTQVMQNATADFKDTASQIFNKMETSLQEISEGLSHDILTRVAGPLSKLLVHELKPFANQNLEDFLSHLNKIKQEIIFKSQTETQQNRQIWRTLESTLDQLKELHHIDHRALLRQGENLTQRAIHEIIAPMVTMNRELLERIGSIETRLTETQRFQQKITSSMDQTQDLLATIVTWLEDVKKPLPSADARSPQYPHKADFRRIASRVSTKKIASSEARCTHRP